jgi:hypothetical protein
MLRQEGQARDMAEKVREELITLKSPPPDRAPEIVPIEQSKENACLQNG